MLSLIYVNVLVNNKKIKNLKEFKILNLCLLKIISSVFLVKEKNFVVIGIYWRNFIILTRLYSTVG